MPRRKTDISFQAFWEAYGMAYGGQVARKDAERVWKRLSDKDKRAAVRGIAPYSEGCRRRGIAMKYAQGYLNGRRWEDVLPETVGTAAKGQPAPVERPSSDVLSDMETW